MLGNNLDPIVMREITEDMARRLDKDTTMANGSVAESKRMI